MKKIMFALVAMAAAVCVQAANVDWQMSATKAEAGWNVFAFVNQTSAELLTLCTSGNADDWTKLGTSLGAVGARGTFTSTSYNLKGDGSDVLTFVLVQGDIAEGSAWNIADSITVAADSTYMPPNSGTTTKMTFASAKTGKFTAGTTPGPVDPSGVPEPTSGVLLLLGGAALALRRRRA